MGTKMTLETSVFYRHLTRLIARDDYTEFSHRESSISYIHKVSSPHCVLTLLIIASHGSKRRSGSVGHVNSTAVKMVKRNNYGLSDVGLEDTQRM
jgi:hypothetical protein